MSFALHIDTAAGKEFIETLSKLHRSAIPVAIRGTLNDAVFDVKTKSMPQRADSIFEKRDKNFFKANSKFEPAKGFDVNAMRATVGFFDNKLQNKSTNYAVKDLEKQEHGGQIDGRSLIAMKKARIGGRGKVRANARMAALKNSVIDSMKTRSISGHGASKMLKKVKTQKLVRAAIVAKQLYGDNAYILGNAAGGKQTLFKVEEVWTGTRSRNITGASRALYIKLLPLYNVKKDRKVQVHGTGFMERASLDTGKKMENMFINQATKQIARLGYK